LHGLAGSSHFLAVLPLLALPTRFQAIGYLIAFAIGTILSMATFSTFMAFLARRSAFSGLTIYRGLMGFCACVAVVIGCVWLFY
jgi:hypothetical protein